MCRIEVLLKMQYNIADENKKLIKLTGTPAIKKISFGLYGINEQQKLEKYLQV